MASAHILPKQDISRLIKIFEAETENVNSKKLTIYSYQDNGPLSNPIVYYHSDTVKTLEIDGILKIIKTNSNIDEHAPGFAGPPFYDVEVFTQKVIEKVLAEQTITKQPPKAFPPDAHWQTSKEKYLLEFDNGKKLEFNNTSVPSAKYFSLLMTNHGLPVDHKTAKEKIKEIKDNKHIRDLVKTLNGKIAINKLRKRIAIDATKKGAYILDISTE